VELLAEGLFFDELTFQADLAALGDGIHKEGDLCGAPLKDL